MLFNDIKKSSVFLDQEKSCCQRTIKTNSIVNALLIAFFLSKKNIVVKVFSIVNHV